MINKYYADAIVVLVIAVIVFAILVIFAKSQNDPKEHPHPEVVSQELHGL